MIKIIPKNKKLLKSSKVRAYLREAEKAMQPTYTQALDAAAEAVADCVIYRTGVLKMDKDGKIVRVNPQEFFVKKLRSKNG